MKIYTGTGDSGTTGLWGGTRVAKDALRVQAADVTTLEQIIDRLEETLEPLRQFILPGGSPAAAHLHLARTICRRAERAVVALARDEPVNAEVVIYLNPIVGLPVCAGPQRQRAGRHCRCGLAEPAPTTE